MPGIHSQPGVQDPVCAVVADLLDSHRELKGILFDGKGCPQYHDVNRRGIRDVFNGNGIRL